QGSWAKTFGGQYTEKGLAIAVDNNGDVAIAGNFTSLSLSLGGPTLQGHNYAGVAFVGKLSGVDGTHLWSRAPVAGDHTAQIPSSVAFDPQGNVVVAGDFIETMDWGNGSGTLTTPPLQQDVFTA